MAKKILVVDDLEQNRMLLKDVLEHYGYEVVEAANGKEGVKMALAELPDLILMDMHMPVMDGYAALQILRRDPLTQGLRVAALTSVAGGDDNGSVFAAGADGYIPKPINIRELPAMMEKIMAGERKPAEAESS